MVWYTLVVMKTIIERSPAGQTLSLETIERSFREGIAGRFDGQRVLLILPDGTRTLPLPELFRILMDILEGAAHVDVLFALGTHPDLNDEEINRLLGLSQDQRKALSVHFHNHNYNDPAGLVQIGQFAADELRAIAGKVWHPSLDRNLPVTLNRLALENDHILILGPTFPHEVAGFSGGSKYLFPGISGKEMIDTSHWMGALAGVRSTIGVVDTPVRALLDAAASRLPTPVILAAVVVEGNGLTGLFIGDLLDAWRKAAAHSSKRHIIQCPRQYRKVLSRAPLMYDELWTAAKAMYKLEGVVADGGELVLYAPHLETVSHTHGSFIYQIGYHIMPYFLENWRSFRNIPQAVLAHSTHLKGEGLMIDGLERPRIKVTLASRISEEECLRLNLGYHDPNKIQVEEWQDKEDQDILYVPRAGEMLYQYTG